MTRINLTISVDVDIDEDIMPLECVLQSLNEECNVDVVRGSVIIYPPEHILVSNPKLEYSNENNI